jgi:hypothetical protein
MEVLPGTRPPQGDADVDDMSGELMEVVVDSALDAFSCQKT